MNRTIAIAVVANGAIQKVVAKNSIKRFTARFRCCSGGYRDTHIPSHCGGACSDKLTIDFHHASITCLNWTKLWVVADLRQFNPVVVYDINDSLISRSFEMDTIDGKADFIGYFEHALRFLPQESRSPI